MTCRKLVILMLNIIEKSTRNKQKYPKNLDISRNSGQFPVEGTLQPIRHFFKKCLIFFKKCLQKCLPDLLL